MKKKKRLFTGAVCLLLEVLLFFGESNVYAAQDGGTVSFYHTHSGDDQNGGGCYGRLVTNTRECGSYQLSIWDNGNGSYNYLCTQCGNQWCYQYKLVGEHCRNTITEKHYERNCGMDNTLLATLSCTKSQSGWTKELDLTASCQICHDSFSLLSDPYVWNGSASASTTYHATQNGNYTLGIRAQGNTNLAQSISITVDNIDNQEPVITQFALASLDWCQKAELIVSAKDHASGLAAQAYSYDGGASWTEQNSLSVEQNGNYSVIVRDAVGNQSSARAEVNCIDRTKPNIEVTTSPAVDQWYDGELTVSVHASDWESGLSECPYSFDGGNSFLVGNSYKITSDCDIQIVVKDRAGNCSTATIAARKKTSAPKPAESAPKPTESVAKPAENGTKPTESNPKSAESTKKPDASSGNNTIQGSQKPDEKENRGKDAVKPATPTVPTHNKQKEATVDDGMTPNTMSSSGNDEDMEYVAEPMPQHYPDIFWQGTPVKNRENLKGGSGENKNEPEEDLIEEKVVLNELLGNEENREVHTIRQEEDITLQREICIAAMVMAILVILCILIGRKAVVIRADGLDGKIDFIGITFLEKDKKDNREAVIITDSMLRRAKTNEFHLFFPFMRGKSQENKKIVVSCHGVSREVPGVKTIHIRLRGE